VPGEALEHHAVLRLRGGGPRGDEQVHGRELVPVYAERFSDQASQPVPHDGIPGRARAHGHAEAGRAGFILQGLHDEQGIAVAVARAARALELGGGVQLVAGPQTERPRRKLPVSAFR
jgi:hypothetical protein